jgi:chromosome segregation ATPase
MEAMLTQMMVKDQRLLELTASITDHEQTIMDLREHVSEKQQVVDTRSKVVQLLQETLTDRDETIREQEGLIARLVAANDKFKNGVGEDQKVEEMQRYFEAIDRSRAEATALKEQLIERDYRLQAQDKHIASLVQQAQQLQQQQQQQQQQLAAASSSTKDAVADVAPGSGKDAEGSSGSLKAAEAKFVKFKAQAAAKIKALEGEVARLKQVGPLRCYLVYWSALARSSNYYATLL